MHLVDRNTFLYFSIGLYPINFNTASPTEGNFRLRENDAFASAQFVLEFIRNYSYSLIVLIVLIY